jgi:tetratricopeptide (TPR) repeat protein
METMASDLLHKYPQSARLFRYVTSSLEEQKKFDELAILAGKYKGKLSDETSTALALGNSYLAQSQPDSAIDVFKALIDSGKGDELIVNQYGWAMVMANDVRPEGLAAVQQTVQLPKNQTFGIVHTLACMYAIAGRFPQAQQNLLGAIRLDGSTDEMNSGIWLGYGLLAESIGEKKAAAAFYHKVQKPKFTESLNQSSYMVAQRRLETIEHK